MVVVVVLLLLLLGPSKARGRLRGTTLDANVRTIGEKYEDEAVLAFLFTNQRYRSEINCQYAPARTCTRTHTRTHARTHAHTHAHTHPTHAEALVVAAAKGKT